MLNDNCDKDAAEIYSLICLNSFYQLKMPVQYVKFCQISYLISVVKVHKSHPQTLCTSIESLEVYPAYTAKFSLEGWLLGFASFTHPLTQKYAHRCRSSLLKQLVTLE